jgi:chromate transporter
MLAFAFGHSFFRGSVGQGLLHGLQLVAVAVVAQAVMAMQWSLASDRTRFALAIVATGLTLFLPTQIATLITIAGGAVAGVFLFSSVDFGASERVELSLPKSAGIASAATFFALLVLTPLLAHFFPVFGLTVISSFYRSGALVFGGGHVVLPLLESSVVEPDGCRNSPSWRGMEPLRLCPVHCFVLQRTWALLSALPPTHSPSAYSV